MRAHFKAYAARENTDEQAIEFQLIDAMSPIELEKFELEGYAYDLASVALGDCDEHGICHDWISVVAYDMADEPIEMIDFGRSYTLHTTTKYGRVWDPSRDYWYGGDIPEICPTSLKGESDMHKAVDTQLDTNEQYVKVIKALFGVEVTPYEGSMDECGCDEYEYSVSGFANESANGFERYEGYTFRFSSKAMHVTNFEGESLYEYERIRFVIDPSYAKTIRTHEEVKDELDRMWRVLDGYEERFVLRRLYEFMEESHPEE